MVVRTNRYQSVTYPCHRYLICCASLLDDAQHRASALLPIQSVLKMTTIASAVSWLLSGEIHAQALVWSLVAAEPTRIPAPELPVGTRNFFDASVGDYGAGQFGFRVLGPEAANGYWVNRNGALVRITQLATSGVFGPGRSGAEVAHQFDSVTSGASSIGPDGQRSFLARAGDPADAAGATNGIWRWNGAQNIEIARGGASGQLGPGLSADWRFINERSFVDEARMMQGGQALVHADVFSAAVTRSRLIARHVPGIGNQPCMQTGVSGGALAPGLQAGDRWLGVTNSTGIGLSIDGRVYMRNIAVLSGPRNIAGIWELCNGAPRALAVVRESGARGPNIGVVGAQFEDLYPTVAFPPLPDRGNGVYFFSQYCKTVNPCDSPLGVPQVGLFHHQSGSNDGIAYNDASGFYGPNYLNSRWKFFNGPSLSVAGLYSSFISSISTTDTTDLTGLWRLRSGQRPELAALIGSSVAAYAPEPGRTWKSFAGSAVFSNGDVVLAARTDPGDSYGIWLLPRGGAPRRVLEQDQILTLQTANGPIQEKVGSIALEASGAGYASGIDDWVGADGTLLLSVRMFNDIGYSFLISTKLNVPNPLDIFADGFE